MQSATICSLHSELGQVMLGPTWGSTEGSSLHSQKPLRWHESPACSTTMKLSQNGMLSAICIARKALT